MDGSFIGMTNTKANNVNLDNLGFTGEISEHFTKLRNADEDKTGEQYFRLTNLFCNLLL